MTNSFSLLLSRVSVIMLLTLISLGCKKNDDTVAMPQTITDRVQEDGQFSILKAAVVYGGVSDALKAGNLTLFAPTDSAFQASGINIPTIISMPKDQVRSLVLYHVLYGAVQSTQIPTGQKSVEMASKGIAFFTNTSNGPIYLNNAKLTRTNIAVANGYIHTINRVLTPSTGSLLTTIQGNANLTFLAAAIKRITTSNPTLLASLSSTTNNITVFAPNDVAFKADSRYNTISAIESADAQALANTLLYHATSGALFSNQLQTGTLTSLYGSNKFTLTVTTNQTTIKGNKNQTAASIKQADIPVSNGVIHIIDQVLQL